MLCRVKKRSFDSGQKQPAVTRGTVISVKANANAHVHTDDRVQHSSNSCLSATDVDATATRRSRSFIQAAAVRSDVEY